jgi:DNA topoisomerase-1
MSKKLVIVESAAKVKTIEKFLGRDFKVMSCQGHVLDLPKSKLGVDLDNGFTPTYVSTPNQKKILTALKKAAKDVEIIFLATDPDREGEAIAFHLAETLDGGRAQRISFNEITKEAVLAAVAAPRSLDEPLYAAQQARRILDRIVGYSVSPILWRKVQTGLSAGRVQSVAVRLICEREAEIEQFTAVEYWTLEGGFRNAAGEDFRARLVSIDGQTLMGPGRLEKYDRRLGSEAEAEAEKKRLGKKSYRVTSYVEKEKRRSPGPPFTTSTLQQAAANALGFTGKKTMAVAQSLYEGVDSGDGDRVGLITYMRTDAVRVASSAVAAARKVIAAAHGDQYLPPAPRGYKSRRGAQEAHEAIRPTDPGRTPESIKKHLTADQNKLYNLIYRRFLASQMADALLDTVAVDLEGNGFTFHASAQRVKFPGFLKVLPSQEKETFVPKLAVGEDVKLVDSSTAQHFTEPPPHYNDASLVRALEGYGIGRPSTYAPIVSTIIDRSYVERRGRAFYPTELGKLVNALLVASFPDVVNVKFTAEIESELDHVEEGHEDWRVVLGNFYQPFAADLEKAGAVMDAVRDDAARRWISAGAVTGNI